jgi:hypothetical protein
MTWNASALSLGILTIQIGLCQAQVTSVPPQKFSASTPLNIGRTAHRESLQHNKSDAVLSEVLDTNVLWQLAFSVGLRSKDLATVCLAPNQQGDAVLYQLYRTVDRPFNKLGARLKGYVEDREDGHTKECLISALTNRQSLVAVSDPDLRIMCAAEAKLPVSWWRKECTTTNAQSNTREVTFVHVDGEIAWVYGLEYTSDGKHNFLRTFARKEDAKHYDPAFKATIRQVMSQVENELEAEGAFRRRDGKVIFCKRVEERLKAKEIAWRSPYSFRQHRYE